MISIQVTTVIGQKYVITHAATNAKDLVAFLEPFIGKEGLSDPSSYDWLVYVDGTDLRRLYECLAAIAYAERAKVED